MSAAIGFAEKNGEQGHLVEVIVRNQDEHFVTEWINGQQPPRLSRA